MFSLHNWASLVFILWSCWDVAGVLSYISFLTYFAANHSFLQQKNIKTNWALVASSIILMEGIISDNYLSEDYFQ